jgi:Domain of unknown function (DUF4386)
VQTQRATAAETVRSAARLGGLAYVGIFLLAIYANFAVRMRLVDPTDATATAQNLAESDASVRLAIVSFTVVFLLDVLIAWALFVVFRSTGPLRALLAAWFRLVYTVLLGAAIVFLLLALWLATSDSLAGSAGTDPAVLLAVQAFDYIWLIGLAAFGIHLAIVGAIIVTSRVAPILLGWILMVAGGAYLLDTFAHLLLPDYQAVAAVFLAVVAVPSMIGELWLTVWLLVRAGRTPAAPSAPTTDPRQEAVRTQSTNR